MVSEQAILGCGRPNQINTSHQQLMKMMDEVKELLMKRASIISSIINSSSNHCILTDEHRPPPAPPHQPPELPSFYTSELSPTILPQIHTPEFSAPQVFDGNSVRNFSPPHTPSIYTSPYTLTIQTTLSTGQSYYVVEPTTNLFGDPRYVSNCLDNRYETSVAEINMKIDGKEGSLVDDQISFAGETELGVEKHDKSVCEAISDIYEIDGRIKTDTEVVCKVEVIHEIETEITSNLEVDKDLKVAMEYVPSEPVKEDSEVKKSCKKKLNAQPNDQAKGVSKLPQPKESAYEVNSGIISNLNSQATFLELDSGHGIPLRKTLENKSDVVTIRSLLEVMKFDPSHDWGDVCINAEGETELINNVQGQPQAQSYAQNQINPQQSHLVPQPHPQLQQHNPQSQQSALHVGPGYHPPINSSASHTYAAALGGSLSRSTTPDPQLLARAPSPRIPSARGGKGSMDLQNVNGSVSYNGATGGVSQQADLVAALSEITLSNNLLDEDNHARSKIQQEIDDHQNLFHLQGDQNNSKQHSYLNRSEPGHLQSARGSYGYGLRGELNNSSFLTEAQADVHKPSLVSPNSYLNGPSTPTHNSGGSSPSQYRNLGSPNSSFSNYALNGYTINPGSPSMLGNQLGNSSLPPLFENVAAATAMGVSGMDSRRMGGLALGPNLIAAAAAELQNMSRVGNQNAVNGLQIPFVDPSYLQYLQSTEFAAAQVAALNKQTMESESLNNYMELAGLQKAYLGGALSPQKSQYGLPYLGKSANLTHGYYGNQAFGLGMSYPGSPLGSALLPNSPIGNGSPIRNVDRSLHFPSGMRNFGGGIMGPWHSETGGMLAENFASSLLDEFKNNKTRCFELSEIAGHVVEFSADQYGSRFIQQKLETATTEEKNMVFNEIMPQSLSLMTDVFGNYVIQKFFEHGSTSQIRELADQLNGHVLNLSLQMYGCRVIQKAIEVVELDQQTNMVAELDGHIMRCVRDQNGNHVIQKCIECIPEDAIHFIISIFYDQVVTLSTHPYGCRVIQRVLEHCSDQKTQQIVMDEIMRSVCMLAQDQYGNYVVQHVLEHGKPHERTCIINKLIGKIVQMSQQKFASNVVEKCLTFGTPEERQCLVDEMLGTTDENEPLQAMMKDQFANYVVQKVLETCDDQQLELILNRIKVHLNALKKYTYGKHIVARVEKLVAAGERRIGVLASYSAAAAAAAAAAT